VLVVDPSREHSAQPGFEHRDAAAAKNAPAEWDQRYAGSEQLWSGRPNGALVAEVRGLPAGRALDVGCGEGADAVWLASQGWAVTGLDVSEVALARAAVHARDAGVHVDWLHGGLTEAVLPHGGFDLVSAQYPALLRTPGHEAERALIAAVAPGGVLLVVHHAGFEARPAADGFDPADYVSPANVAALLDDDWQTDVNETRPRDVPNGGAGAHHLQDVVLRALRLR
jgi:SAM-dependent methyltransferase